MSDSMSRRVRVLAVAAVALSLAVGAAAQATQTAQTVPGAPKVTTTQLKGEVAEVQGDYLLVKMAPRGDYRLFQLRPGKTATIDGVVMPLNKVKPGTVLTALRDRHRAVGCRPDDHDPERHRVARLADRGRPDARKRREPSVPTCRRASSSTSTAR